MTRIAIAHDYLTQRGGAERVVLALARAFPGAPIFTTLYDPAETYPEFRNLDVRTSDLDRFAVFRRNHRAALPLLPLASSRVRIDADLVIASSSGWAHGFPTTGLKLVYCYSPARWLYESDRYLGAGGSVVSRSVLRILGPALRRWDKSAARSADRYLAISTVTQGRVRRVYGRDARIVPAPHSVSMTASSGRAAIPGGQAPGYFLIVSRLLPYKNVMPAVQAFAARQDLRLVVVGAGPQKDQLVQESTANVSFLEGLTDDEMQAAYSGCIALIAASHEDFGLTPIEAAAHGKPSVVLRWGGFLDTVVEGVTGVFFDHPDAGEIADALDEVTSRVWDIEALQRRAEDFSESVFAQAMHREVDALLRQRRPAIDIGTTIDE